MTADPILELDSVSAGFPARRVLDKVSLTLFSGQRIGITGPSGAGKSTLARVLTLHQAATGGRVRFHGAPLSPLRFHEFRQARRALQLVFQDPANSFRHQWPLWRIVSESAAIDRITQPDQRRLAIETMRRVHLDPAWLERRPLELSGGERRRLAIARALAANPGILVLDESLSGLDLPLQAELVSLLNSFVSESGLCLVTVSHDIRLLRKLATDVLVLDDGRVVESGSVRSVLGSPTSATARTLVDSAYTRESAR